MTITAFHGTSSRHRAAIAAHGLDRPYVTDDPARAAYYAREEAEAGGDPLVFELRLDERTLRYDRAAMDEPVMAAEARRDRAWRQAELDHPEWLTGRSLVIPPEAWQVSWTGVGSARVAGVVRPSHCLRAMTAELAAVLPRPRR